MAYYAGIQPFRELQDEVGKCARKDVVDAEFAGHQQQLDKQKYRLDVFYYPKEDIDKFVKRLEEHGKKNSSLIETAEEFAKKMEKQIKSLKVGQDKHADDLMDQHMRANEIEDQLKGKVEKPELTKLWTELERYAFYEDFKDLYQKTVIPVQKFEQELLEYDKDHKKMRQMIKQFDENLSLKSNKKDIWKLENDLESYALKSELKKSEEINETEILVMRQQIDVTKTVVANLQETMQLTVFDAVKKAKRQIEKDMEKQNKQVEEAAVSAEQSPGNSPRRDGSITVKQVFRSKTKAKLRIAPPLKEPQDIQSQLE